MADPQNTIMGAMAGGPMISGHHEAMISKVENGFIVRVGCKTFVALDWKIVSNALSEYWEDPQAAREKFTKK